ncbi:hypothetical protein D1872_291570 [compost metagenome]
MGPYLTVMSTLVLSMNFTPASISSLMPLLSGSLGILVMGMPKRIMPPGSGAMS